MASAEVSTALCKLSRLCSARSTVSRWITKTEQRAAKSEHLLQDRGFRCFMCSCIFIFLFIFAPQQRGGKPFITARSLCRVPLLSVHYCIMQGCIFQAWLTVIRKLNGGEKPNNFCSRVGVCLHPPPTCVPVLGREVLEALECLTRALCARDPVFTYSKGILLH